MAENTSTQLIAILDGLSAADRQAGNYPVIVHDVNLAEKRKVYFFMDGWFTIEQHDPRITTPSCCLFTAGAIDSGYHVWNGEVSPSETVEAGTVISDGTDVMTVTAVSPNRSIASVVDASGEPRIIKLGMLNVVGSGWSIIPPDVEA